MDILNNKMVYWEIRVPCAFIHAPCVLQLQLVMDVQKNIK